MIGGSTSTHLHSVWPDWAIYWTLGKFLKRLATIYLPNLPHSLAIFVKVSKSIDFLVKSFWATFIDIWRFFSGHTVCIAHDCATANVTRFGYFLKCHKYGFLTKEEAQISGDFFGHFENCHFLSKNWCY